jgi:hypothetical protein
MTAQDETEGARAPSAWRFVASCGLLTLPILLWNAAFTHYLPPALGSSEFWRGIPPAVTLGENGFRFAVVLLPFLMPLDLSTAAQRRGLWLFAGGMLVYFAAWIPLMLAPEAPWSTSSIGFLAPAYTPLLWLAGIGLIGRRLYWPSPYRPWIYIALSCAFVAFHTTHAAIVYARLSVAAEA